MKLLTLLTTLVFFSFSLCAQSTVPSVKEAFNNKFPGAKSVQWEYAEDDKEYEAAFKYKKKRMTAKFDPEGAWLETEYEIKENDLPAAVKMAVKMEFADHEIDSVEYISTPERKDAYEVTLDAEDETWKVVFTASGKILQKELDDEQE